MKEDVEASECNCCGWAQWGRVAHQESTYQIDSISNNVNKCVNSERERERHTQTKSNCDDDGARPV